MSWLLLKHIWSATNGFNKDLAKGNICHSVGTNLPGKEEVITDA